MRVPPFDIKLLGANGLHRIALAGELDLSTCPRLVAAVQDLLATRPRELEIDLRRVSFIDSTGLRTLVLARDESDIAGVAFYIVPSESPQVHNVFVVTTLHDQSRGAPRITNGQAGARLGCRLGAVCAGDE